MAKWQENPLVVKLYEELPAKINETLKQAVEREGLTFSNELLNSIHSKTVTVGDKTISAGVVFSALLRIKDLKRLDYSTIPPIGPLVDWVERIGVGNFAYVPGYPNGIQRLTESERIIRIAKGVQYNLKARPTMVRGYRGIYNEELYKKIIPEFIEALRASSEVWAKISIEEALGFDVKIPEPGAGLNASRIQAAWNARDTKIAREYAKKQTETK